MPARRSPSKSKRASPRRVHVPNKVLNPLTEKFVSQETAAGLLALALKNGALRREDVERFTSPRNTSRIFDPVSGRNVLERSKAGLIALGRKHGYLD